MSDRPPSPDDLDDMLKNLPEEPPPKVHPPGLYDEPAGQTSIGEHGVEEPESQSSQTRARRSWRILPSAGDLTLTTAATVTILTALWVATYLYTGNYSYVGVAVAVCWIAVALACVMLLPKHLGVNKNRPFWLTFVPPSLVLVATTATLSPRHADRYWVAPWSDDPAATTVAWWPPAVRAMPQEFSVSYTRVHMTSDGYPVTCDVRTGPIRITPQVAQELFGRYVLVEQEVQRRLEVFVTRKVDDRIYHDYVLRTLPPATSIRIDPEDLPPESAELRLIWDGIVEIERRY